MPAASDRIPPWQGSARKDHPLRRVLVDAARIFLIAVLSLAVGSILNGARKQPLPWKYIPPSQRLNEAVLALESPAEPGAVRENSAAPTFAVIDLDEFQGFVSAGRGTVIDARAEPFYKLGHVPGALNLPRETFAADYERQKNRLEANRTGETIVYCSEADCPDAELVAGALARLGFQHLRVYKEGWEEWTRAGLPQEGQTAP